MRILYIHQYFATRDSQVGLIRSYEFARRWVEQGHDVTVVTSAVQLPEEFQRKVFTRGDVDGIDVRSVRVKYSNYMSYPRRMWAFVMFMLGSTWTALRAPHPDVVYATSTPLTVGIPGVLASRLRGVPFVFEVRDLWPEAAIQMGAIKRDGLLARWAKWLERGLYRAASRVVCCSPGMAEGVKAEGKAPDRVHVVPNSADLDLFHPGEKDAGLVAEHGLSDKFVVGYTGAIGPSNAVEAHLPAAARILHERGRDDIVFLVVGDGKRLPALRDAVDGLPNVVLTGSLPKKDVPRVTRTADVLLVLFADVDILGMNSPNKFFDAMASGRPVIVNSAGWTKGLVEDNDCGCYARAGDGEALAACILRMADDRATLERMGGNARRLAEERFSRDDLAAQLMGILEKAAAEGPAAR